MINTEDKTILKNSIKTTWDLDYLINNLDNFKAQIFKKNDNVDALIDRLFQKDVSNLIRKNNILDPFLIEEFKKDLMLLPLAVVTVSHEPTNEIIDSFFRVINKNSDSYIILDVKVDSKIVSGFSISINGKFYDYTLKSRIEKFVLESQYTNLILNRYISFFKNSYA